MVFGGPSTYEFSRVGDHLSSPSGPERALAQPSFLLFLGSLRKGLGLATCTFLCIVSLRVWCILSSVLGRRGFSYGLGVFDFPHEEVKRAVGLHL